MVDWIIAALLLLLLLLFFRIVAVLFDIRTTLNSIKNYTHNISLEPTESIYEKELDRISGTLNSIELKINDIIRSKL